MFHVVIVPFLFPEVDDKVTHLGPGALLSGLQVLEASDTRGDESEAGPSCRCVHSKRTHKIKTVCREEEEIGQIFVTGATDAFGRPGQFYCNFCQKKVPYLTHGSHEILPQFQGSKNFLREQRFRPKTPSRRVQDYEGISIAADEVGRQR